MNDTPLLLRELGRRSIPAALCFGAGALVLLGTSKLESANFLAACSALFGLGFFVAGAVFLGPTLAKILVQPSGNLFYPVDRYTKPQPVYSIPRSRRLEGKFRDALEGYRLIVQEHPQERNAYLEMIDIALRDLHDDTLAESILMQGMEALAEESDRKVLQHKFIESMQAKKTPSTYKASP